MQGQQWQWSMQGQGAMGHAGAAVLDVIMPTMLVLLVPLMHTEAEHSMPCCVHTDAQHSMACYVHTHDRVTLPCTRLHLPCCQACV
jgi:hypothetical protein